MNQNTHYLCHNAISKQHVYLDFDIGIMILLVLVVIM